MLLRAFIQALRCGQFRRSHCSLCDIFLPVELKGEFQPLREVSIFNPSLSFSENQNYSGFIGANLHRIKAVAVVTRFSSFGIQVFNVPAAYRDNKLLSEVEAYEIAKKHLIKKKTHVLISLERNKQLLTREGDTSLPNPMFWCFLLEACRNQPPVEGMASINVDRLDGHIWSEDEMAEYQYDYNNII